MALASVFSLVAALLVPAPAQASVSLLLENPQGSFSVSKYGALDLVTFPSATTDLTNLKFLITGDVDRAIFYLDEDASQMPFPLKEDLELLMTAPDVLLAAGGLQLLTEAGLVLGLEIDSVPRLRTVMTGDANASLTIRSWFDVDQDNEIDGGEVASPIREIVFFDNAVSGTLLDATTGDPIAGHTVQLYGQAEWGTVSEQTSTAADGTFTLRPPQSGRFSLVYNPGSSPNYGASGVVRYLNQRVLVEVGSEPLTGQVLKVARYPTGTGLLTGTIDPNLLDDAPRLSLNCQLPGTSLYYSVDFDPNTGYFEISNLPQLDCYLQANATGFLGRTYAVDLRPLDAWVNVDVELAPEGTTTISGTVTDSVTGDPVEGVVVHFHTPDGAKQWWRADTTDSNGYYEITGAPSGVVLASVGSKMELPRYHPSDQQTIVVPSESSSLTQNFLLEPMPTGIGAISGFVFDESGKAILNGQAAVTPVGGGWTYYWDPLDKSTGAFDIPGLPLGSYNLEVAAQDLMTTRRLVTLTDETPTVSLNLELKAPGTSSVSGTIFNKETGAPVSGAWVGVNYQTDSDSWWGSAHTDIDGKFEVTGVPEGLVSINVWPNSGTDRYFYFEPVKLEVSGATNFEAAVEPYPSGSRTLEISLTGIPQGQPASVLLQCPYQSRILNFNDYSTSGLLTISGIPALDCNYTVSSNGYLNIRGAADLASGDVSVTRTFTLKGSTTLSGVVRSSGAGNPVVPGATVTAYQIVAGNLFYESRITNENGEYSFTGMSDGDLDLWVSGPDAAPWFFDMPTQSVLISGDTAFDPVLEPLPIGTGGLSGIVVDSTGKPIADANVWICGTVVPENRWCKTIKSDALGVYRLGSLPAAEYTIYLSKSGYLSKQIDVTVGSTFVGLNILMQPSGSETIRGRVVREGTSAGLSGVWISASWSEAGSNWSGGVTTDLDGFFEIRNAPRGSIDLYFSGQPDGYFGIRDFSIETPLTEDLEISVKPYPVGTETIRVRAVEWLPGGGGTPIASAQASIDCSTSDGNVSQTALTDSFGVAEFTGVVWMGSCEVAVGKDSDGFLSTSEFFYLEAAPDLVEFELLKRGDQEFEVQLLGPDGAPIANNSVTLGWNDETKTKHRTFWAISDSNGIARFGTQSYDKLPRVADGGSFVIVSMPPGGTWLIKPPTLTIQNGSANSVTLNFEQVPLSERSASISGVLVRSSDSARIAGATITAYAWVPIGQNFQSVMLQTQTAPDGSFTFSGLMDGQDYRIEVEADTSLGIASSERTVFIAKGVEQRNIELHVGDSATTEVGTGMISGFVLTPGGNPISGAWLSGVGDYVRTNSRGYFEFVDVPFGTFTLNVESPTNNLGRAIYKQPSRADRIVKLSSATPSLTGLNIVLQPYATGSGSVSGQLWSEESQVGIGPGQVNLASNGEDFLEYLSAPIGPDGRWLITDLPDGEYTISFSPRYSENGANFLAPASIDVAISGGQVLDLGRITTRKFGEGAGSLRVSVIEQRTQAPAAGVSVGVGPYRAEANEFGVAEFTNLAPGRYYVWGAGAGYSPLAVPPIIEIGSGHRTYLLEVRSAARVGSVTGTVKDRFGNPIQDAFAVVELGFNYGNEGGSEGVIAYTDGEGRFVIDNLPLWEDMPFTVEARDSGRPDKYAQFSSRVTLSPESPNLNVDIVLQEVATLKGKVIRPPGTSAVELYASAISVETGQEIGLVMVEPDGTFEFTDLPGVDVYVKVKSFRAVQSSSIATGYYYQRSALVAEATRSPYVKTVISLQPGQTYNLVPMTLFAGNTVSGTVKFLAGTEATANLPRRIAVKVYFFDGAEFILREDLSDVVTDSTQGGRYEIAGLPDGRYIFMYSQEDEFYEPFPPIFSGGDIFLNSATEIVLSGGGKVTLPDEVIRIPEPTSSITTVSVASLSTTKREALKDLVRVTSSGSELIVDVGLEMAGEWVSVSLETSSTIQSLNFREGFRAQAVTSWYPVRANGTINVNPGNLTPTAMVVQDAKGRPLGWVQLAPEESSEENPIGGGGSGGGGGGGGFFPMPTEPQPLAVNPIPTDKSLVVVGPGGQVLQVTATPSAEGSKLQLDFGTSKIELAAPMGATFDSSGKLAARANQSIGISASGYLPGSTVKGYLVPLSSLSQAAFRSQSDSVLELGSVEVGNDGAFLFDAKLSAMAGDYLLQITGVTEDGNEATIAIATSVVAVSTELNVWTKNQLDGTVKVYAKNIVGKGKIQFKVNGREIAWVNAVDETNPKLRQANGAYYLVRTVKLIANKKVSFEIYLDGVRLKRNSYTYRP